MCIFSCRRHHDADAEEKIIPGNKVSGMWNTGIGGSHDSPTFYTNPQYLVSLDATQAANLDVRIVGDIDQSVNLKLLRGTERVSK